MEKSSQKSTTTYQISESRVTSVCNKLIDIFNEENLAVEEATIVLSQLLIYSGKSMSKKNLDFDNLSWEELEKEYYSNNKDNDIGLGLVLNGGAIMQAINIEIIKDSDETANKGNENVQVSTTNQISQKNRSTTNRPKTRKRIS